MIKHIQLEQVAQDVVQLGTEYLQGWRICNFSGWLAPVFELSHSKKLWSYVQMDFQVFYFKTPVTGHFTEGSDFLGFVPPDLVVSGIGWIFFLVAGVVCILDLVWE